MVDTNNTQRMNISDNVFSNKDIIEMAEKEYQELEEEYLSIPNQIDILNEFILDHRYEKGFEEEVKKKRIQRQKLYARTKTLVRRLKRAKRLITFYKMFEP